MKQRPNHTLRQFLAAMRQRSIFSPAKFHLEWTDQPIWRQIYLLGKTERPTCPGCGAIMVQALPPGGKGQRTFLCFDCDRPDPLKTDKVTGWLEGELQPPK
jgi:hypothetical protein